MLHYLNRDGGGSKYQTWFWRITLKRLRASPGSAACAKRAVSSEAFGRGPLASRVLTMVAGSNTGPNYLGTYFMSFLVICIIKTN